jgi:hypothetical protein
MIGPEGAVEEFGNTFREWHYLTVGYAAGVVSGVLLCSGLLYAFVRRGRRRGHQPEGATDEEVRKAVEAVASEVEAMGAEGSPAPASMRGAETDDDRPECYKCGSRLDYLPETDGTPVCPKCGGNPLPPVGSAGAARPLDDEDRADPSGEAFET